MEEKEGKGVDGGGERKRGREKKREGGGEREGDRGRGREGEKEREREGERGRERKRGDVKQQSAQTVYEGGGMMNPVTPPHTHLPETHTTVCPSNTELGIAVSSSPTLA